ncbi:MAG TPA: hypothetical protein VH599_17005 [Ktedonobacterales bacterium]|jgi:hypothetical protein
MVKEGRPAHGAVVVGLVLSTLFLAVQSFATSIDELRRLSLLSLAEHYLIRLVIISALLLAIRMLLVQGRHWNQVDYRRQMAAAWGFAAHVPLAQPHPLPNVGALPLPFTIKQKVKWLQALPVYLVLCLGGGFLILPTLSLIVTGDFKEGWQAASHGPFLILSIEWSLIIAINVMAWWLWPRQIAITSEGLTVGLALTLWPGHSWRPKRRQSTIPWNQARLFAIRDGKPNTPATHYELSSPYVVVQWTRLRRPRWWSFHQPAIPFAEYDAQMEALIALITGITGLPLYDVR